MSIAPFQRLPGSSENWGADTLSVEPWLMPISDRAARDETTTDALAKAVRQSSRRLWLAANALCAGLALLLTAQIATDWSSSPVARPVTGHQVADATPPTLPVEKASLHH
ncbi:hypothetical protein [Methylorubrum aminovorans]|uniref:Uncharacterized protein n=1 Tax=Methylorubrum aminovorans TaxID=269069 RepID=A0ABQ4UHV5_9HYPH|nr:MULTISPECIES: hypothetical protein [Methylobacteriaceae]AWI90799.1 hypothetical protein C0214_22815 [Methylobacterium sp. DM1]QIJ76753.1 hypothetical protein CLZ_20510 [Methylobacterium sp. CLZ]QIJ81656.1 hypothetical protein GU700_20515 [Methylobacterium sp. NI91]GJE66387.1 hypothetical protein LNAOJCKE_3606 [Methylorubrum aminovorans]GMA75329.1 hypothetical protein GCM10025880_17460 [Methylorubrum aminovorans]